MDPIGAEVRAERLRVAVLVFGLVREPPEEATHGATTVAGRLLTSSDVTLWAKADETDYYLANACITLEREHRERHWRALEVVLPYLAPDDQDDDGDDAEPWPGSLTDEEMRVTFRALSELGWTLPPPEPDEA